MDERPDLAPPEVPPSAPKHGVTADPRALGFAAFATTTFVFGLSRTTIWSASVASLLPLALIYGGAIQVLAGIWSFTHDLTFAATTFCSFGAFYVSYYLFVRWSEPTLHGASTHTALALFFLAWLIFSSYVFLASLAVSRGIVVIYFFWSLTFLLLVLADMLANKTLDIAAGASGIVTAGAAWYASAAFLVNNTFGKVVLPFVDLDSNGV